MDPRTVIVALVIGVAPVTIVALAIIIRGYNVNVTMRRGRRRRRPPE